MDKTSRQQRADITKNKIATTVEKMLSTISVSDLKIRDICQNASVSIGTFYSHFSCKEEAVLYIYRLKDDVFANMNLKSSDPLVNIESIILTLFKMVDLEHLDFSRHIYICHLTYYDEYFFSEERTIFQLLNQLISQLTGRDSKKITIELLEYCRGKIYNLDISFKDPGTDWYDKSLQMAMDYLDFLLNH